MIQHMVKKIMNKENLTEHEAYLFMKEMANGNVDEANAASLLSILHFRGESAEEIAGFVRFIREQAVPVLNNGLEVVDTCGTGGDGYSTFNVSTAVSLVLASIGLPVAKHGNAAITSKSGSMDVIRELKLPFPGSPEEASDQLSKNGICFLNAPDYHPVMKKVADFRKKIPFRTIFNLAGPISNPIKPAFQLIGACNKNIAQSMARTLQLQGIKKALVVSGRDGLDECSIAIETDIFIVEQGEITHDVISPEEMGLSRSSLSNITVSSSKESAEMIRCILLNRAPKEAKDIVVLNTAAALFAADKAPSIREGVAMVKEQLQSGKAYDFYQRLTTVKGVERIAN